MNFTPLEAWRIAFYLTGAIIIVFAVYLIHP
jgi:hypothetical protein